MRGHHGGRKSRIGSRLRSGAARACSEQQGQPSKARATAWLTYLVAFIRLSRDKPTPPSVTCTFATDPRVEAETELLLAKAARERAEAEMARAQAAYWQARAEQQETSAKGAVTDAWRGERAARREDLEIESLEVGTWIKVLTLAVGVGCLLAHAISVLVGLPYAGPDFPGQDLISHFNWLWKP